MEEKLKIIGGLIFLLGILATICMFNVSLVYGVYKIGRHSVIVGLLFLAIYILFLGMQTHWFAKGLEWFKGKVQEEREKEGNENEEIS